MPAIKEPCKQEACNIQSCLTKNAFNPERCLDVILKLQKCCDHFDNKSTHCASVKPLLQQITKKTGWKQYVDFDVGYLINKLGSIKRS